MFISKKKFDEAIKNAKEEVYKEAQRRESKEIMKDGRMTASTIWTEE